MSELDERLEVPQECVDWCHRQPYERTVLDDIVMVDLDWWNHHLRKLGIPATVVGREVDGHQIDRGLGYIRRGDLERGPGGLTLGENPELDRLYMCAAWLTDHPMRTRRRRFVDVRNHDDPLACAAEPKFDQIFQALVACETAPALFYPAAYREWSGWPVAPGVGPVLMSLYCWAIHRETSDRPQLLDAASAGSLTWHGWMLAASVSQYTVKSYGRYTAVLRSWSEQAATPSELIEMWLNREWHQRLGRAARSSGDRHVA